MTAPTHLRFGFRVLLIVASVLVVLFVTGVVVVVGPTLWKTP